MKTFSRKRCYHVVIIIVVILPLSTVAKADSNEQQWASWVLRQVNMLPGMQSQRASLDAVGFDRKADEQPLYNPTLDMSYDDREEREYSAVFSQSIDWSGKRNAAKKLALVTHSQSTGQLALRKDRALSEALYALVAFNAMKALMAMVGQQEMILDDLSQLIAKRQRAGDLGLADVEMAYLSLSESLQNISTIETEYYQAQAVLANTLDVNSPVWSLPDIPVWFNEITALQVDDQAMKTPAVIAARQLVDQRRAEAYVTRLNKKADPTIGLGFGKDGEEDYVGLQLSIPLNVRNNYSARYSAAQSRVTEAELVLADATRLARNQLLATQKTYQRLSMRLQRWQLLMDGRIARSQTLLEKQWRSGDINTAEYLFALQQRADAIAAGIELTRRVQQTWVDWLYRTGQVEVWLTTLATTKQIKG